MDRPKLVGVVPLYAFFAGASIAAVMLWRSSAPSKERVWEGLGYGPTLSMTLYGLVAYVAIFGLSSLYLWLRYADRSNVEVGPARSATTLYALAALILLVMLFL